MDIENLENYKKIHLIGIGGISMSAIAETLKSWGYTVTGSDANESELTNSLISHGINVKIGHNLDDAKNADLIIYSAAINEQDPEMIIAKENNIPLVDRGEFVGYLTKLYKESICISGTHGKTTTTSMISICFLNAKKDPSIQVGAILDKINGNYKVGNSDYFILESCEYKGNFLKFFPKTEVILNIDNDHLDYYKTFENIVSTFKDFSKLLDENGLLVTNADDKNCFDLKEIVKSKFVTYGIENSLAEFKASNISFDENGFATFDVLKHGTFYNTFSLSVAGKHNIYNALACIAVCDYYGISSEIIKESLLSFRGASRRLELKCELPGNIKVFDDYAHHPTEIKAIASAVKCKSHNELWAIFQPHTYSRTLNLLDDFVSALSNFDHVILVDIYAAREQNTFGISSQDLVNKLKLAGKDALFIPDFNDVVKYVKENAHENDIVLTVGAGTVTEIGKMF